jgi:hypothetical protein
MPRIAICSLPGRGAMGCGPPVTRLLARSMKTMDCRTSARTMTATCVRCGGRSTPVMMASDCRPIMAGCSRRGGLRCLIVRSCPTRHSRRCSMLCRGRSLATVPVSSTTVTFRCSIWVRSTNGCSNSIWPLLTAKSLPARKPLLAKPAAAITRPKN